MMMHLLMQFFSIMNEDEERQSESAYPTDVPHASK